MVKTTHLNAQKQAFFNATRALKKNLPILMGVLKVNGDTIINASFMTDGCGTTIASGSMVTEMVKGKSISEAQKTTQRDILDALGGLPQESEHCALLAANTLKAAIRDIIAMKREPWKKAYPKDRGE